MLKIMKVNVREIVIKSSVFDQFITEQLPMFSVRFPLLVPILKT